MTVNIQIGEKTRQNTGNKQTFDLTVKIETEGKSRQNAENKQTFGIFFQLCLSTELYPIRSMGHRLRHNRRQYLTNHSTKQVTLSGTPGRVQRRIVSRIFTNYSLKKSVDDFTNFSL